MNLLAKLVPLQSNENMIHNHITEHCEKFKLLHSAQHGFRNKHSTT